MARQFGTARGAVARGVVADARVGMQHHVEPGARPMPARSAILGTSLAKLGQRVLYF